MDGTQSDGKHVLAYCDQCGSMQTPVGDLWIACACGGRYFVYPHVALRDDFPWKLTASDRRLMRCMLIGTEGFFPL